MNLRKYRRLFVVAGLLFLFFSFYLWDIRQGRNNQRAILQSELTTLRGTLSHTPTIEKDDGPYMDLYLREYPDFNFQVDNVKYRALKAKEFTREVKAGDTVLFDILTYDFDTKIQHTRALRLSDRLINYRFIEPYSIQSKGKSYMELSLANHAWKENHDVSMWVGYFVLGAAVFIGIIFAILHFTGLLKRFKMWWAELEPSGFKE